MRALQTMYSTLRPGGVLLDVRPAPERAWVEVHRAGTVRRLGQIDDPSRVKTLAASDAALQVLIDAGRFVREREQTFPFVYHFDSVDAWLAYMAEHWSSARVADELIGRAREALSSHTNGELRIVRSIHAARLRRLDASLPGGIPARYTKSGSVIAISSVGARPASPARGHAILQQHAAVWY